jgi:hypothetical protein
VDASQLMVVNSGSDVPVRNFPLYMYRCSYINHGILFALVPVPWYSVFFGYVGAANIKMRST